MDNSAQAIGVEAAAAILTVLVILALPKRWKKYTPLILVAVLVAITAVVVWAFL
jgi:hypothetical protein